MPHQQEKLMKIALQAAAPNVQLIVQALFIECCIPATPSSCLRESLQFSLLTS